MGWKGEEGEKWEKEGRERRRGINNESNEEGDGYGAGFNLCKDHHSNELRNP